MEKLFDYDFTGIGRSGKFEVFKQADGKYLAKMISWNQYQANGPGDVIFWRTKTPYRAPVYVTHHWDAEVARVIGEEVEKWEFEKRWQEKK